MVSKLGGVGRGASYDDPDLHELHGFLEARRPEQGPARVVHGDYGLHNCLVNNKGELTAVLDWEISTLGDPMADFAYALNTWAEPSDELVNKETPQHWQKAFWDGRNSLSDMNPERAVI